jgi:hypothetical protein
MPDIKDLNIICYKWGTLYGPHYVNRLYSMVGRHLSAPFTFHCITDDATGLADGIKAHPLPDLGIEGIWRKLMTFQDDFLGLKGEYVVSLDLDIVIVDSIDFLLEQPGIDFYIGRNWARKEGSARASGSVYRLKVGSHAFVWDRFYSDRENAVDRYHGKTRLIGEQNWLDANIPAFNFFPEGKVVSFKRHCKARGHYILGPIGERFGWTTAAWGEAVVPPGAAIVSFHGDPLPPDVRDTYSGRWRHAPFVSKHWH